MQINQRGNYSLADSRIEKARLQRLSKGKNKRNFKSGYFIIGLLITSLVIFMIFKNPFSTSNANGNEGGLFALPTPTPTISVVDLALNVGEIKEIELNGFRVETNPDPRLFSVNNGKLTIRPSKSNIGQKSSLVLTNDKNDKTTYETTISLKELDFNILQTKVEEIIGKDTDRYGVYIKDLKRNKVVSLNAEETFAPASISKVPIAIMALKDIQSGKFTLESTFPMKQGYKVYDFDGMSYIPNGRQISLDQYISTMLRESDNTGMTALENILGGVDSLNSRYKKELGITNFYRMPHESKASDISMVFENIYTGKYLDKERNDYLLNLLQNTADRFDDRIVAGVEGKDATVAHKIGQVTTDMGYSYNDAGIVYGPQTDFIVVIIDQGVGEASAREKIVQITKETYEFLNE